MIVQGSVVALPRRADDLLHGHRVDAVALEVASGRSRVPGARPGRVPAGLSERAALLGGTVEVTSCREAISVRVVLPVAGALPVVASAVAA